MVGLRQQAEQDLAFTLEDRLTGWAWPVSLTNPEGFTYPLVNPTVGVIYPELNGLSNDIALAIDPDTGAMVSGRTASLALRISTLERVGFDSLPKAMTKPTDTPWVVRFPDINGKPYVFKVVESRPDRTIGVVVCMLEIYNP